MLANIQGVFAVIVQYVILFMEMIGVSVLVVTAVKSVMEMVRGNPDVKMNLAEGICLALEFKLGGEVLRTLIAQTWSELAILGAVVALRAAITFLLQWEIRMERKNHLALKEQ